jgi:PAS domain S-box-containing protein
MSVRRSRGRFVVRGMEILSDDPPPIRRQKLARITLDSMVQFVGLLDAQGTVLEINHVALDAVGISLADVEGKPFWTTFWWQVSEDISRTLREAIARAAQGEIVRWDTPIFGRAGGKETIIIDASLSPVHDDDGKVVFICAEGRDITEKKAQERLIAQQNVELSGLLQRIRELDEIKTQFFANVSHELRTPLALILGPAQRLIDDDGSLTLAERREVAQVTARNARMLLKHVNDLLDMSKLEARKLKIELSEADVAGLLRLLASHFAVLAADRRIDFEVDAAEPCVACVDADKLQRVVMNLLGNAFKFVPAGGRIRGSVRQTAQEIVIAVDDSGPGVKPADRQSIFERFRQGDGGIDRKVGGTGLGLAIAKEFVEMHRGRIEVLDSELGGARFQVSIPRVIDADRRGGVLVDGAPFDRVMLDGVIEEIRAAQLESREPELAVPEVVGRPRVLVVEDNPDMNRFVTQCLSAQYDVVSAFDGREGLERALSHRPALIVSDIMMPNVSGVEMINELLELPEFATVPILLLSAKADEELMVRLLEQGARDFIVKPFSERDLLVRVRNLIAAEHAREQAELQKRLLYSVFMQAPLLISVLRGPDHVIELANPPMREQLLKRDESELRGRSLFEVVPALREQNLRAILDRVYQTASPQVVHETPLTLERSDGSREPLFFDVIYSPLRSIDGRVDGIFVVASDVTAQVHARQQMSSLRDAAESASRAKDEFLAMLGHELRNPLSPILTALQLMRLRGDAGSERERTVIERQVSHLTRLVDDLLDVARIARGRVELQLELVELSDIVARALEMASPLIEERAHRVSVAVPRGGLRVEGDPTRLGQIISNLLTNAAKYTPPGGDIRITGEMVNEEVVLRVRDNGIGIAADVLPRVFDLFVQEQQTLDRSRGGLGIGLTIVKNLVERHGGSIAAHSEGLGKGSEFVLRLPLALHSSPRPPSTPRRPERNAATIEASQPAGALTPARRVLIVDDNEDGAEMLAAALSIRGYTTRVAHDAAAALRIAAEFRPEVAFLDIGLPVMDGYELAAHLRAAPGLAGVHLVALTGYGQAEDRRRTSEAGFRHHLVKPVDLAIVESVLADRGVSGG